MSSSKRSLRLAQQTARFAPASLTKGVPVIGGALDYGLRVGSGENPIDAAGRTVFGTAGGLLGGGIGGLFGLTTGPGAAITGFAGGAAGYTGGTALYDQLRAEPQQIRGRSGAKRAANNDQAGSPVMYGTLPGSARVVTDYPEGIPTGVGGGNAGQAQSLNPNAPGGGYIAPTSVQQNLPVTQLSPQDRAYAKERARVEAMIKANPDMQKQDIAAARAKVRDQGMVEFAKANPKLAKRVKPGQVGYEVIRDTLYPMPTSLADPTIPDLGYNIDLKFDPSIGRTVSSADVTHSVVDKTTKLPPSAEQTYMDADFYQLQGYQQGQGAAASQTEGPKIAKLGSAIRRELYPQFDNKTSMSYQMREMFPDRSTQSLENTIKEKGVQLPGSMINIDAKSELVSGATDNFSYQYDALNREVDKLLNMIYQNRLEKLSGM